MADHLSVATEGLSPSRFSVRNFAVLGFNFAVQIISTPVVADGSGYWEEVIPVHWTHTIVFTYNWNGKPVKKEFEHWLTSGAVNIFVELKKITLKSILINFKTKLSRITSPKAKPIVIAKESSKEVKFNVTEKELNIKVTPKGQNNATN